MLIGGWQNSALCKHIDLWNVNKNTVKQNWMGMTLKIGDMATKGIVFNEGTGTVIVLGRKALHFIDIRNFTTEYNVELGEDGAEVLALKFSEACKGLED